MLQGQYGVGASTIREALTRLAGEFLVTQEEQRGFRVAPISLEDFSDLISARKIVEVEAVRLSVKAGDDAWEARLVSAFHSLSKLSEARPKDRLQFENEYEYRNREFHNALISACKSHWLNRMYSILFQQAERYRRFSIRTSKFIANVNDDHRQIFDAALAKDVERSCRLVASHIDNTLKLLSKILPKQ
jgi:DNA-binding GntR family transcriptional regulator